MKKIGNLFLTIFAVGILVCLLAGGVSLLGFVAALVIGGETATSLCVFIHKQFFPWVIKFTSVFAGIGLLGMYTNKISALRIQADTEGK